jgi:signal transduction histidine kinase/phage shock protein PspC (stress-responsive transcriptional regulator)
MPTPHRLPIDIALPDGLTRHRDDRYVAGVCAGVARWLSVDPTIVRLAVVVLTLGNGVGLLAYLVAWAILPEDPAPATPRPPAAGDPDPAAGSVGTAGMAGTADLTGAGGDGVVAGLRPSSRSLEHALAVGSITLGALLLVRWMTPFFPDELVWPATVVAAGVGLAWSRADEGERARWRNDPFAALSGRGLMVRLALGGMLLISGIAWFLSTNSTFQSVGAVGMAVLATLLGIAVLLGPWIARARQQMLEERRERIRSEERADMAAHLHDSVLQTLALIQRHADSPPQARSLARRQERELRAWLFDARTPDGGAPTDLAAALDQISDDVEADHDVKVEPVVVGDNPADPLDPLDEPLDALLKALREAVVNAARHSGEPEVSVYVEVAGGQVEAFVRDRGRGFVPEAVDPDRRGISDSIVGRMHRHGGSAHVRSRPGEGTEVALHLALDRRDRRPRRDPEAAGR